MGGCIDRLDWVLCYLMGKEEMLFVGLPPYTYITNPLRQINIAHMLCQNMLSKDCITTSLQIAFRGSRDQSFAHFQLLFWRLRKGEQDSDLDGERYRSQKNAIGQMALGPGRFCTGSAYTVTPPGLTQLRAASP
jgi:hypothetical protein